MAECPVCGFGSVPGKVCPNCESDLSPFFRAREMPRRYYERGKRSLEQGRLEQAIEAFAAAVAADPAYADARAGLGEVYARKGWLQEATAQFDRALELAPSQPEIQRSREEARVELERRGAAGRHEQREAARRRRLARALPVLAFLLGMAALLPWRRSPPPPPPPVTVVQPAPKPPPAPAPITYRVRPGDSLSRIAQRQYGSPARWRDILEWNKDWLHQPGRLRVGETIYLRALTIQPLAGRPIRPGGTKP